MTLNIPHTFTAGTKAKANQVNENFAQVKNAVDNLETAVSQKLEKSGDKLSGNLDADGYIVSNLGNATASGHALNLGVMIEHLNSFAPRNFIDGFTLSNNASDANNDIDIASGACTDSTNTKRMSLVAAITKRLDSNWSAGNNQGGLDTGNKANLTWYHVFVIAKEDGTTDALFSASASDPVMPEGYTYKRRIGSIKTDSSGNIIGFYQNGDVFLWIDIKQDISGVTATSTAVLRTLSVPSGINVYALVNAFISAHDSTGNCYALISSPLINDTAVSATMCNLTSIFGTAYLSENASGFEILTNTSSQIRTRNSGTNGFMHINTLGWKDLRGRQ